MRMILGIDVGNTQTVLGLFSDDALDGHWRVSTDATLTADELRVKLGALLALEGSTGLILSVWCSPRSSPP